MVVFGGVDEESKNGELRSVAVPGSTLVKSSSLEKLNVCCSLVDRKWTKLHFFLKED